MSIGWSSPVRWQRVRILSPVSRISSIEPPTANGFRLPASIQWASAIYAGGALFFLGAAHLTAGLDDARLATALLGGMVRAGIYTAYMLLSKRFKATFVVRLTESAPELSAPAGAV
jgi:hypothetical protein